MSDGGDRYASLSAHWRSSAPRSSPAVYSESVNQAGGGGGGSIPGPTPLHLVAMTTAVNGGARAAHAERRQVLLVARLRSARELVWQGWEPRGTPTQPRHSFTCILLVFAFRSTEFKLAPEPSRTSQWCTTRAPFSPSGSRKVGDGPVSFGVVSSDLV